MSQMGCASLPLCGMPRLTWHACSTHKYRSKRNGSESPRTHARTRAHTGTRTRTHRSKCSWLQQRGKLRADVVPPWLPGMQQRSSTAHTRTQTHCGCYKSQGFKRGCCCTAIVPLLSLWCVPGERGCFRSFEEVWVYIILPPCAAASN